MCYEEKRTLTPEQLYENQRAHIECLLENGCDLVLSETIGRLDEVLVLNRIVRELGIQSRSVLSLLVRDDGTILSGERVESVLARLVHEEGNNFLAYALNCCSLPAIRESLRDKQLLAQIAWGVYANCGQQDFQQQYKNNSSVEAVENISPATLRHFYADLIAKEGLRPVFIGSCCVSNPNHTLELSQLAAEVRK